MGRFHNGMLAVALVAVCVLVASPAFAGNGRGHGHGRYKHKKHKRHYVYSQLVKAFPREDKSRIALLLEQAVAASKAPRKAR